MNINKLIGPQKFRNQWNFNISFERDHICQLRYFRVMIQILFFYKNNSTVALFIKLLFLN